VKNTCVLGVAIVFLSVPIALANKKNTAVPAKVLSAKTIYVDNRTTDVRIQYIAEMDLAKWGRFQLVDSVEKAEIVLRLSGANTVNVVPSSERTASYYQSPEHRALPSGEESVPTGYTRITLLEPKTGAALWTDQTKTKTVKSTGRLVNSLRDAIDQQEKSHWQ
jgi:hypothetical protein